MTGLTAHNVKLSVERSLSEAQSGNIKRWRVCKSKRDGRLLSKMSIWLKVKSKHASYECYSSVTTTTKWKSFQRDRRTPTTLMMLMVIVALVGLGWDGWVSFRM